MTFSLVGFGAEQLRPTPAQFQALSLGGGVPAAPAQPYGTPNERLVPVARSGDPSVPANLTLAALPVFIGILHVNRSVSEYANPGFAGAPNTTSGIDARNPSISQIAVTESRAAVVAGPSNSAPPQVATRAGGTVTFETSSPAATRVTIYAGTTVQTSNGVEFNVLLNTVIEPGSTIANATVQAVNPGSGGNVAAGAITEFAQNERAPAGVSVTNVSGFSNGADAGQQATSSDEGIVSAVNAAVVLLQNSVINPLGVNVPQGDVSFSLTQPPAYVTNDAQLVTNPTPQQQPSENPPAKPAAQPVVTSAPSLPPSSKPQYVEPVSGSAVARIVQTVTQLAVSAIYPAPLFSFSA